MPAILTVLAVALILLFTPPGFARDMEQEAIVVETRSSYRAPSGEPTELAAALAQYGARRRALEIAANYFLTKGLIASYGPEKEEIYSLATKEIQVKTVEAGWTRSGELKRYVVRIESRIYPADFFKAEILARKLEKERTDESLREELEPKIPSKIDPAADLARAYRYFRTRHWREALIYLDRLESKYPHWGEISMAKAIAFYALQDPLRMKAALQSACAAEISRACEDLSTLKKVHELDFGP